jgi:hypothetical protein
MKSCNICGEPTDNPERICQDCRSTIEESSPGYFKTGGEEIVYVINTSTVDNQMVYRVEYNNKPVSIQMLIDNTGNRQLKTILQQQYYGFISGDECVCFIKGRDAYGFLEFINKASV